MLTSSRDNWERLVAAVVKRQQIWELCHQQSRTPSICSTITSDDDLSEQFPSFSGSNFEPFSVPPSPLLPPTDPSISQVTAAVSKSASSRPITRMLFSAWSRIRKSIDKDMIDIFAASEEDVAIHLRLLRRFYMDELRVVTRDFSAKIRLDVYKGRLADGSPVAVKSLPRNSPNRIDQFKKEVEINNIVAHPNMIHILGFCITRDELLLVYPLMANGSVASCIWERGESQPPLNLQTRKGIALGAARAVAYLHEEIRDKKVLHCDIKPANILLNENFEAVVADFGLALVAEHDAPDIKVHNVQGTIGYIAPEFRQTFRYSEKCDVYGYGAFLLALISGKRSFETNIDGMFMQLHKLVERKYMESKWEEIVDTNYTGNYMEDVVKLLVQIGLLCILDDPEKRPKMSEVVRMIEDGDDLTERVEELLKHEDQVQKENNFPNWIIDDDTSDLAADELSGPR